MDNEQMEKWAMVNESSKNMALLITKHMRTLPRTSVTQLLIDDIVETHGMLMGWEKSHVASMMTPEEAIFVGKVIGRLECLYAILSKMVMI